jgi:hypothetical protein
MRRELKKSRVPDAVRQPRTSSLFCRCRKSGHFGQFDCVENTEGRGLGLPLRKLRRERDRCITSPWFRFKVQRCANVIASYGPRADECQGWLAGRELTNFEALRQHVDLSGTDLALPKHMKHEPAPSITLNAAADETRDMNPLALLTPTYGRDLELCNARFFGAHWLTSSTQCVSYRPSDRTPRG